MPNINAMGKIITILTIINRADQIIAARGFIPTKQVRTVTLDNVLVDTGATTLCLPANIIEQLGLELLKEVNVETANGIVKRELFYVNEKEPLNA